MNTRLFLLAATALTLAACSNDSESADSSGLVEIRLTSTIEAQTRAAANTQGGTLAENEKVYVWVDDAEASTDADATLYKAVTLTANSHNGFDEGTTMYFPTTGHSLNFYSMHGNFTEAPTEGSTDFPTGGIAFSVATTQNEIGSTAYTNSDLLYAIRKGVAPQEYVSLCFYHMLSKLELAIKLEGDMTVLASENAVTLGDVITDGTFTPDKTTDPDLTYERADMLTAGTTTTTMNLGNVVSTDFTDANIEYNEAVIVPQDMSGKVLTFTLANGTKATYTIPDNTTFECGKKYRYHLTLSPTGVTLDSSTISEWTANETDSGTGSITMTNAIDISKVTEDLTITRNTILYGTATTAFDVTVEESVSELVLKDANFYGTSTITINGTVTMRLMGESSISTSASTTPAITVTGGTTDDEHTLTITGSDTDKLTVTTTGSASTCINSANAYSHINITGGYITATASGYYSCGIGGTRNGESGNITISGGIIDATGGHSGAAIGSTSRNSGKNITISGGTVTATVTASESVGIGAGLTGTIGLITISGGTVTATAYNRPAIGCGRGTSTYTCKCEGITITGGTITATSTNYNDSKYDIGIVNTHTALHSECGFVYVPDDIRSTIYRNDGDPARIYTYD